MARAVLITGGAGFIGRRLAQAEWVALQESKDRVMEAGQELESRRLSA
ncbi:MAG: hypothetical protein M3Y22_05470 [Pseudomonadota bacterium]|nr:hypothetical protein [Pseudomonadota bacterium]